MDILFLSYTFPRRVQALAELEFGTLLDFEETISHLSGSLIEIGRENQVAAIHLTIKEFFLSDQAGDFQVKLEEDGNIARTCLNYLRYDLARYNLRKRKLEA